MRKDEKDERKRVTGTKRRNRNGIRVILLLSYTNVVIITL